MSNSMVGTIYQKIMEEVINGCVVTFEEEGVDKKLLDEVKQSWQKKLSERNVALMPWDPAPNLPQQSGSAPTTGASNRSQQPPPPAPVNAAPGPMQPPSVQHHSVGPQIKQEVKQEIKQEPQQTSYDLANLPGVTQPPSDPNLARERANNLVKEKMAANQQGANVHPQAQMAGQPKSLPPQASAEEQRRLYQRQLQQNQMRMSQTLQQRNSVGNAQTDGAGGDWEGLVQAQIAGGHEVTAAADASLKDRMDRMDQEMEGGGLMVPLSEIKKKKPSSTIHSGSKSGVGQFDGPDDDDPKEEEDEDAINSDLDDTDDDQGEEAEDDGNSGELMVCTYDKVQRVKNKWKCTLKDGVLSTGGKEYVFHKAQGEFEW